MKLRRGSGAPVKRRRIPNRLRSPVGLGGSLRVRKAISRSKVLSSLLCEQLRGKLPSLQILTEHRFHPERRWRFDLALPETRLAVEIEGGSWVRGAHTRGAHFEDDAEKYAFALLEGWRVLRVLPSWVETGRAAGLILAILDPGEPRPSPRPPRKRSRGRAAAPGNPPLLLPP